MKLILLIACMTTWGIAEELTVPEEIPTEMVSTEISNDDEIDSESDDADVIEEETALKTEAESPIEPPPMPEPSVSPQEKKVDIPPETIMAESPSETAETESSARGPWGAIVSMGSGFYAPNMSYTLVDPSADFEVTYSEDFIPQSEIHVGVTYKSPIGTFGLVANPTFYRVSGATKSDYFQTINAFVNGVYRFDHFVDSLFFVPHLYVGTAMSWIKEKQGGATVEENLNFFDLVQIGGGIWMCLDWIEPHEAALFDEEYGVRHTYVFAEFKSILQLKSTDSFDLSSKGMYLNLGLAFEL